MELQRKPIVILGPMESESAYLAGLPEHPSAEQIGAYRFVSGTLDGYPVVIGRTYIGMVNSAAAATLAIDHFDPLCVIIQGTSGAHDPDLHQGDIVLGERIVHVGRYFSPHRDAGDGVGYTEWSYEGSEMLVDGDVRFVSVLRSDPEIIELAAAVSYPHGRVIRGAIGSADIWNRELDMIAQLHERLGTCCEEMEGFAVAQVCAQMGVRCADIRVISNSEWHPDEAFDEGYGRYCQEFCLETVRQLIRHIK